MTIHKEGYASLALAAVVLGLFIVAAGYIWAGNTTAQQIVWGFSLAIFLGVLQFFRHPNRAPLADDITMLAPADGTVVVIETVQEDEYLHGQAVQVSIFMSPFNVHVTRSPLHGLVTYFKYHPGKYLVAWHPKSSSENERTTMVVQAKTGAYVLVRQIAGALARRIVWYAKPGQPLAAGQEFGFIKFGSRVDVFLPVGSEILVRLNDKTVGGETLLARLPQGAA